MVDKSLIEKRFARAISTYDEAAEVQYRVAKRLMSYVMACMKPPYDPILEIGSGTGILTRMLIDRLQPKRLVANDLCDRFRECLKGLPVEFLAGDAELVSFPCRCRLIISSSTLQWFSSPDRFFEKSADTLSSGGLLAISSYAPGTMAEVSVLTGKGLSYLSLNDIKTIIGRRFEVLVAEQEDEQLHFDTPKAVLEHLKKTGVTAVGSGDVWTRERLMRFCRDYSEMFALPEGGVVLTYRPIYVVARKIN